MSNSSNPKFKELRSSAANLGINYSRLRKSQLQTQVNNKKAFRAIGLDALARVTPLYYNLLAFLISLLFLTLLENLTPCLGGS